MLIFKPAPVIVLEGIFVMHYKKLRKAMDLSIFMYAKENLKVIRRIKRDQSEQQTAYRAAPRKPGLPDHRGGTGRPL